MPPTGADDMLDEDVDLCDGELIVSRADIDGFSGTGANSYPLQGDGEDEDINIVDDGSMLSDDTRRFNSIVGALEDVLMDPEFEELREGFYRGNCHHFEDTDENKLVYTELFNKYTEMVEGIIDAKLKEAVPGFSMQEFMVLLESHKDNLMAEVFDFLLTLADFEAFKEAMLSYKSDAQEGPALEINCTPLRVHIEEQEDGDVRPDLDLTLRISPIGAGPGMR